MDTYSAADSRRYPERRLTTPLELEDAKNKGEHPDYASNHAHTVRLLARFWGPISSGVSDCFCFAIACACVSM